MMRGAFLVFTALFWMAVLVFGSGPLWWPEEVPRPDAAAAPPEAVAAEKGFTLAEVARHARPDDCWMAIDRVVYDFTAYLPRHPAEPDLMTAWCGKEATEAYRTKMRGRPHSPRADQLMQGYRIGRLDA